MKCKHCGTEISDSAKFCPECGAKVEETQAEIKEWYFVEEGQSKGTYSQSEMISYYQQGRLNTNTYVWKQGLAEWVPLKSSPLAMVLNIEEEKVIEEQPKQEIDWYYISSDSKQNGPYTKDQMVQYIERGLLNANTYIWATGMSDWVFVKNSELAPYLNNQNQSYHAGPTSKQPTQMNPNGLRNRSIGLYVVLSIVTCSIFAIYWIYTMANDLNNVTREHAGEYQQTSAGLVVLLSVVTCGIYGWYWLYKAGKRLSSCQFDNGFRVTDDSVIMLILSIFGLGIVSYCILQSALNDIVTYGE